MIIINHNYHHRSPNISIIESFQGAPGLPEQNSRDHQFLLTGRLSLVQSWAIVSAILVYLSHCQRIIVFLSPEKDHDHEDHYRRHHFCCQFIVFLNLGVILVCVSSLLLCLRYELAIFIKITVMS